MFDLSWGEMGIIAVVALVVLGPKELPNALRTMSALMKNARKLAGEFQSGVNEIIREADLEDARKKLQEVTALSKSDMKSAIEKAVDPTGEMKTALTIENDPTSPAKTETTAPAQPAIAAASGGDDASGEDHAVEIAAAQPVAPSTIADPVPVPQPTETEKT